MDLRRTSSEALRQRVKTGPLPRLPAAALKSANTLEARMLPGLFLAAFVALIAVQIWLALG